MSTKAKRRIPNELIKKYEENWKNPMKKPYLEKLVLNIGVGIGGQELEKAVTVLETISGRRPIKTLSKKNIKEFNLRKGRPIGTMVTLRGV
ncbi:MAG: 50S ribosomal protein L5, partial [Promethearchaeota archaeon]